MLRASRGARSQDQSDWTGAIVAPPMPPAAEDPANAGIRREPELPEHEEVSPAPKHPLHELEPMDDEPDDEGAAPPRHAAQFWERCQAGPARPRRRLANVTRDAHQTHIPPAARPCRPACRLCREETRAPGSGRRGRSASHLSPDGADRLEAALARRLDRMTRHLDRLERHVTISNEALAVFVRFWLTSTPPLPETALPAAQAKGRERYEGFVEALGRRLARGRTLSDEIVADVDPARSANSKPPSLS